MNLKNTDLQKSLDKFEPLILKPCLMATTQGWKPLTDLLSQWLQWWGLSIHLLISDFSGTNNNSNGNGKA